MSYNLVDPTTGELTQVAGNAGSSVIIDDSTVSGNKTWSSDKIKAITNELRKFTLSKTDYQGVEAYPTECGVYRVIKKIDGIPNDASPYATLIIYGNGYFTHIYHDTFGRMWIGYTADSVKAPTWQELATMDKVANSIIREGKSVLYNLNNVDNIEVAIDIAKPGYKPIAVSLYNAGTHLWFAQGIYFNDTVCNLSLRGVTPTSATNAECKVLVTYIKIS